MFNDAAGPGDAFGRLVSGFAELESGRKHGMRRLEDVFAGAGFFSRRVDRHGSEQSFAWDRLVLTSEWFSEWTHLGGKGYDLGLPEYGR
jgi:hypothetical protein